MVYQKLRKKLKMNKEETENAISVMSKAKWVDGLCVNVEYRVGKNTWFDCQNPIWDWPNVEYRIRPENSCDVFSDGVKIRSFEDIAPAVLWAFDQRIKNVRFFVTRVDSGRNVKSGWVECKDITLSYDFALFYNSVSNGKTLDKS